jgi:acyl-CoA synthetase (AMP-forming)/AMP-acid ligase II
MTVSEPPRHDDILHHDIVHDGILHALAAATASAPDRLAVACGERRLSYAQLSRAVAGMASWLVARGLSKRRVVVAMPSGIEAEVAVLAVLASGAQVVPINPFFTPPELRVVLAEADPSAIVTGPEAEAKLLGLEAERGDCLLAGFGTTSSRVAALDLDAWIADETLRLDMQDPFH